MRGGVPGVTSGAFTGPRFLHGDTAAVFRASQVAPLRLRFQRGGSAAVFRASGVTPLLFLVWWSSDIIRLTLLFVVACDGSRWARCVWLS